MRQCVIGAILLAATVHAGAAVGDDIAPRIAARGFPSVFQAWNPATPLPGRDADAMLAMHDLAFLSPSTLGLKSDEAYEGAAMTFTSGSVTAARARRATLLAKNPHLILLAEVRYRDAPKGFLSDDSQWWKRDEHGEYVLGWAEGGYRLLDLAQPAVESPNARRP